jgi:hypothetical protein
MYKIRLILSMVVILLSVSCAPKEKTAISIDGIKITKAEFEKDFEKFNFSKPDTTTARKEFVDNIVNRKLILKEAETTNLDKDPAFLEDVQDFWEQSLLKIAVDKKAKQLFMNIKIEDKEIDDFYNANKDKFENKPISDVYGEIRLILFKKKQQDAVTEWIDSLKNKANVKVDYKLLGLEQK